MAFAKEKNSQAHFPNEFKVQHTVSPAPVCKGAPGTGGQVLPWF